MVTTLSTLGSLTLETSPLTDMNNETAFELIREFIVDQYEELQPEGYDDVNDYVIDRLDDVVEEYSELDGEFGDVCRFYRDN